MNVYSKVTLKIVFGLISFLFVFPASAGILSVTSLPDLEDSNQLLVPYNVSQPFIVKATATSGDKIKKILFEVFDERQDRVASFDERCGIPLFRPIKCEKVVTYTFDKYSEYGYFYTVKLTVESVNGVKKTIQRTIETVKGRFTNVSPKQETVNLKPTGSTTFSATWQYSPVDTLAFTVTGHRPEQVLLTNGNRVKYDQKAPIRLSHSVTYKFPSQGTYAVRIEAKRNNKPADHGRSDNNLHSWTVVVNSPPIPVGTIGNRTLLAGYTTTVDVARYFSDPGDTLTYRASSNNTSVMRTPSVSGSVISSQSTGPAGTAKITVTASDNRGETATQTFSVTVPNVAPERVGTIANRTLNTNSTTTVNVKNHFKDRNNDTLSYTASSSNTSVATASVSGSVISSQSAGPAGTAKITVTASDNRGETATQTFSVTVPNVAPERVGTIANRTLNTNSTTTVNVKNHFKDRNNDTLSYTASSSNTSVATASVSGSNITVSSKGRADSAIITVTAKDNSQASITQTFTVTVNASTQRNNPPVAVRTIPNQILTAGGDAVTLNMADYFKDADGDTLTYSVEIETLKVAIGNDELQTLHVVLPTVSGSVLTLTPMTTGTPTVAVTAKDPNQGKTTQTFTVTVMARPPSKPFEGKSENLPDGDLHPPGDGPSTPKIGKIYWAEYGSKKVRRANLDGSNVQDLITNRGNVEGITLDMSGGKIYWSAHGVTEIQRMNLDGTNAKTTHLPGATHGIALDVSGGKMYWVEFWNGRIQRGSLNSGNVETLVTGLRDPLDIALDVSGGKMYWVDARGKIQRANLDGANVQVLVSGLDKPTGIALDVSDGKMYWTDHGAGAIPGKVQRANLDGSNVETLVSGLSDPWRIALDVSDGKMYWTDIGTGKIQRANLTGGNVKTLVSGLNAPKGIALGIEAIQPMLLANRSQPMNARRASQMIPVVAGDLNYDGVVNILDLVLVASQFGTTGITAADLNGDRTVNIQDLVLVAKALGNAAAAPSAKQPTAVLVNTWLQLAQQNAPDTVGTSLPDGFSYARGIQVLEQLARALTPDTTALFANYPNPFNPETWIPYQLAKAADVAVTIYASDGSVVRTLALGHQDAGIYKNRTQAAYWDGTNELR